MSCVRSAVLAVVSAVAAMRSSVESMKTSTVVDGSPHNRSAMRMAFGARQFHRQYSTTLILFENNYSQLFGRRGRVWRARFSISIPMEFQYTLHQIMVSFSFPVITPEKCWSKIYWNHLIDTSKIEIMNFIDSLNFLSFVVHLSIPI